MSATAIDRLPPLGTMHADSIVYVGPYANVVPRGDDEVALPRDTLASEIELFGHLVWNPHAGILLPNCRVTARETDFDKYVEPYHQRLLPADIEREMSAFAAICEPALDAVRNIFEVTFGWGVVVWWRQR